MVKKKKIRRISDYVDKVEEENENTDIIPSPISSFDKLDEDLIEELQKLQNPYLENPKPTFRPLSVEKPKHKEAFLYWMCLDQFNQTDTTVAGKFNVSPAVVGRWRKSFNWEVRRDYLRKEELKQLSETASNTLTNELMIALNTVSLAKKKFHQDVQSGSVDITVNDYIKLCELQIRLRKELSVEGVGQTTDSLKQVEKILSSGGELNQTLIHTLQVIIGGDAKLPHDVIINNRKETIKQEMKQVQEIGDDDESVEIPDDEDLGELDDDAPEWEYFGSPEGNSDRDTDAA